MKRVTMATLLGAVTLAPSLVVAQGAAASPITRVRPAGDEAVRTVVEDGGRTPAAPDSIKIACPDGTTAVPFDMPVYDESGLFVIGHETVWFCVPDDLEPAG